MGRVGWSQRPRRGGGVSTSFVGMLMVALLVVSVVVPSDVSAGVGPGWTPGIEGQGGLGGAAFSPSGSHLTATSWRKAGLLVLDLSSGRLSTASLAPGAGFHPAWVGGRVLFKEVVGGPDGAPVQRIVAYDPPTETREIITSGLHLGDVSASTDGSVVVWTRGATLEVYRTSPSAQASPDAVHELPTYANLAEVSPDGASVALNDDDGRVGLLSLETGIIMWLPVAEGCSHPAWSPDGSLLLLRRPGGGFVVFDVAEGTVSMESTGTRPAWVTSSLIVYDQVAVEAYQLVSSSLWSLSLTDGTATRLSADTVHLQAPAPGPDGASLAFVDTATGSVWLGALAGTDLDVGDSPLLVADDLMGLLPPVDALPGDGEGVVQYVPYMHQLWDTPDDFNGSWSCGPTSCVQTIQRFGRLPDHPITASWPSSHESLWGWYIPSEYTYNGYTYDTLGIGPGDVWVPGAHGFILLDEGYALGVQMVDFFSQHGLESGWSGTAYSAMTTELDEGNTAYFASTVLGAGHIIVCRGYMADHTVVINDPYGDANSGDWGEYDGEAVLYDWPGYNNGHLEIDVGYIFPARGPAWESLEHKVTCPVEPLVGGETATMTVTTRNQGSSFWLPGEVHLSTADGITSPLYDPATWTDDTTPATVEAEIVPGQHWEAAVTLLAPDVDEETTLTFSVVLAKADGETFGPAAGALSCDLTVVPGVNQPPVADAKAEGAITLGDTVTLDGSGSYDPDGALVSWTWLTPEGFLQGQTVAWTPPSAGEVAVTLTVMDDEGAEASDEVTIVVAALPVDPAPEVLTPDVTEAAEEVVEEAAWPEVDTMVDDVASDSSGVGPDTTATPPEITGEGVAVGADSGLFVPAGDDVVEVEAEAEPSGGCALTETPGAPGRSGLLLMVLVWGGAILAARRRRGHSI